MNDWIVTRPELLGGKPCIRGTRISVEFVLELLASGATPEQILQKYPQVTEDGLVERLARRLQQADPPSSEEGESARRDGC